MDVTNWSPSGGDAAGILISNFSDLKIWVKELNERNLLSNKMKNERTAWIASISFHQYIYISKLSQGRICSNEKQPGHRSSLLYQGESASLIPF